MFVKNSATLVAALSLLASVDAKRQQLHERGTRCNGDNLLNRFRGDRYSDAAISFCQTFINSVTYSVVTVSTDEAHVSSPVTTYSTVYPSPLLTTSYPASRLSSACSCVTPPVVTAVVTKYVASSTSTTSDDVATTTSDDPSTITDAPSTTITDAATTSTDDTTTSTDDSSETTTEASSTTSTDDSSTTTTEDPSTTATEDPSTTATEDFSTTATEDPSTTATEDPSTTATEDPSTTATEDPSTTATEDPSTTATEDPSTTATEDPSTTSTDDPSTTTEDSSTTATDDPSTTSTDDPSTTTTDDPSTTTDGSSSTATEDPSTTSTDAATTTTDPPTGPTSLGCYVEGSGGRALKNLILAEDTLTIELCAAACTNYAFYGVEYGRECWCDDVIERTAFLSPDPSVCNMACKGDTTEICGGSSTINIYGAASGDNTTPSESPYTFTGCFAEPAGGRALPQLYASTKMTIELCHLDCSLAGYTYAGLEYSTECWCGNSIPELALLGPESCSAACAGDATETCGGNNALQLYTATSSS